MTCRAYHDGQLSPPRFSSPVCLCPLIPSHCFYRYCLNSRRKIKLVLANFLFYTLDAVSSEASRIPLYDPDPPSPFPLIRITSPVVHSKLYHDTLSLCYAVQCRNEKRIIEKEGRVVTSRYLRLAWKNRRLSLSLPLLCRKTSFGNGYSDIRSQTLFLSQITALLSHATMSVPVSPVVPSRPLCSVLVLARPR